MTPTLRKTRRFVHSGLQERASGEQVLLYVRHGYDGTYPHNQMLGVGAGVGL